MNAKEALRRIEERRKRQLAYYHRTKTDPVKAARRKEYDKQRYQNKKQKEQLPE